MQAAEGRACVIAVNKWDTVPVKTDKTLADYEADVRAQVGWQLAAMVWGLRPRQGLSAVPEQACTNVR